MKLEKTVATERKRKTVGWQTNKDAEWGAEQQWPQLADPHWDNTLSPKGNLPLKQNVFLEKKKTSKKRLPAILQVVYMLIGLFYHMVERHIRFLMTDSKHRGSHLWWESKKGKRKMFAERHCVVFSRPVLRKEESRVTTIKFCCSWKSTEEQFLVDRRSKNTCIRTAFHKWGRGGMNEVVFDLELFFATDKHSGLCKRGSCGLNYASSVMDKGREHWVISCAMKSRSVWEVEKCFVWAHPTNL